MQGNTLNKQTSLPLALVCIVLIFISAAFSNFEVIEVLAHRWVKFDENLGHALPMLGVCIFFLFKALKELVFREGVSLLAFAFFPVIVFATWVMKHYDVLVVQQLLVWLFIALSFLLFFRTDSTKTALFAIGLLVFVIPVWDQLIPFLAELTTYVVQIALKHSGIVAFFDGRNIELPSGIITVADACSGVRYVTIGLALSYLSAFTLPITLAVRIKIILLGLLLSIFANWLRVYIIVLVGYHSEMQSELVGDHELFGFILFFVVISPIALYKPKLSNGPDKLGEQLFGLLEGLFNREIKSVPVAIKLLLLVAMSITTALTLKLF